MEIVQIGSRNCVENNDGKHKTIPLKYLALVEGLRKFDFDFSKKLLFPHERFKFEVMLYENNIKSTEPYLYELIEGVKPTKVFKVECKFNDDRYEILYGEYSLKCSEKLYKYADKEMQHNKKSQL